jgi:ferredoxin
MKRWKTALVALISLWLPLQGYGAVAMPFCQQHGMAAAGAAHAEPSQEHHGGHSGHMAHADSPRDAAGVSLAGHGSSDAASGLACNNCGVCHLACSPAISAISSIAVVIGHSVLEPSPADSPHFFYPEQLQRPPLSALL